MEEEEGKEEEVGTRYEGEIEKDNYIVVRVGIGVKVSGWSRVRRGWN